jgi:thiol-disulfide isomerase/thioredoxin
MGNNTKVSSFIYVVFHNIIKIADFDQCFQFLNLVFLDFWASLCKPCIEEIPAFKKLQKKYKNDNIVFVSIGIESKKESIQRLIEKHELNGIHLFDPSKEKELKDAYSVSGIPHYVLIDKLGNIIESFAMKPSNPQLYNQIDNLLK